jgi:hypothetical protein
MIGQINELETCCQIIKDIIDIECGRILCEFEIVQYKQY